MKCLQIVKKTCRGRRHVFVRLYRDLRRTKNWFLWKTYFWGFSLHRDFLPNHNKTCRGRRHLFYWVAQVLRTAPKCMLFPQVSCGWFCKMSKKIVHNQICSIRGFPRKQQKNLFALKAPAQNPTLFLSSLLSERCVLLSKCDCVQLEASVLVWP